MPQSLNLSLETFFLCVMFNKFGALCRVYNLYALCNVKIAFEEHSAFWEADLDIHIHIASLKMLNKKLLMTWCEIWQSRLAIYLGQNGKRVKRNILFKYINTITIIEWRSCYYMVINAWPAVIPVHWANKPLYVSNVLLMVFHCLIHIKKDYKWTHLCAYRTYIRLSMSSF